MTGSMLGGARVRLVPVGSGDVERISDLLWQPSVRQLLCDGNPMPRADIAALVSRSLDPASIERWWRIETPADGFVGLCGLHVPAAATLQLRAIGWRSLETTIALQPAHWRRGLAREAIEAMAGYAGGDGVTFAIVAAVAEPNLHSRRLLEACGFAELGRVAGPVHTLVVYERPV
jgi:RimJ/RimL family protein N-acetyltransferase